MRVQTAGPQPTYTLIKPRFLSTGEEARLPKKGNFGRKVGIKVVSNPSTGHPNKFVDGLKLLEKYTPWCLR
jgi:hypothetical protein